MADSELQLTLDRILKEKNEKLIPENIKKGVTILGVTGNATIDMTDATATPDDIVAGKTAYLADGITTGRMVNNGAVSISPSTSQQSIPAGYHNGSGKVRAVTSSIDSNIKASNIKLGVRILGVTGTLADLDTSDATANRSQILSGATAYVNGTKITGTMSNRGSLTISPSTSSQSFGSGYYSVIRANPVTAAIDSNIKAGNIKQGVTILGVEGNLSSTGVDTTDATANASRILSGYTAYINNEKVTGTMSNRGSLTVAPKTYSQSYGSGYYSGISVSAVTASIDSDIIPENIKNGVTILGVTGTLIDQDIEKKTETITPSAYSNVVRSNTFYSRLTVARVTSNIDGNIQPANIKKGVSILGVSGTLETNVEVNYEAGTLTILSAKYVNYSPVWKDGTITSDFVTENKTSGYTEVENTINNGYAKIRCYFDIEQAQDVTFEFVPIDNMYAVFSEMDTELGTGTNTTTNVYVNTNNLGEGETSITYSEVEAGSHFVEIKVFGSANGIFQFKMTGINVRQKIISQVYASIDAMNNDKSQSVGTYGFIFSLVDNAMTEVYRYNGENWLRHSIGDYTNTILPNEYIDVLEQIDDISGEVIM